MKTWIYAAPTVKGLNTFWVSIFHPLNVVGRASQTHLQVGEIQIRSLFNG